ncbi:uncharacterized domain 1-containing protein [Saccharicrinis carchari]|uniref:Acyl-coenzyme A thioesterase THEM4 n=1 Tax=Saccharicrinis carchari TaxID=1168039 RepID=A0A521EUM1_SACCC|nr:PaaI family thioesterase [Saccharicrinis carchari]SMO87121.1 uncharacterized domain 1-containing protein [Saccharicrinis carchari]
MKKIVNPFVNNPQHQHKCFGCSPQNPIGLQLEFWDAGEEIIAKWLPKKQFEGYMNVVHGGIQATLHDEIASWVVYTKCQTMGVTSNMEVQYKKPLMISGEEITIKARLESPNRRLVKINTLIQDYQGTVCSIATVTYFLLSQQKAKMEYNYPGIEAFYEK